MAGHTLAPGLWPQRRANAAPKSVPGWKQDYLKRGHRAFYLKGVEPAVLIEIGAGRAGEKRTVPAVWLHSGVGGWSEGVSFYGIGDGVGGRFTLSGPLTTISTRRQEQGIVSVGALRG